ncbi:MAG: XTP/dITP diphosphohydrolase [Parcubacteria bacterium C7867-001]|nr:MAG: XTP/dITP diphosphohydrolase [Parcubacteria bacterium C7867-001]
MQLVYGTMNKGKLAEVSRRFGDHGFTIVGLADMGIPDIDIPETGTTLGENAALKVRGYLEEIRKTNPNDTVVLFSDDTGLEIDGLGGEPGIHVRRWRDRSTRMSDEEVIEYALTRMQGLTGDQRAARFRCILTAGILYPNGTTSKLISFCGTLKGRILEEPEAERMEGFPFASLMFIDEWGMLLGTAERLPQGEKEKYLSHREKAIDFAIPFLTGIK